MIESKSLLAKLMATENLKIEQRNVPTASFNVKERILTIPILDEKISPVVMDLFMGHEVGHALYTPLEGLIKAKEEKVIPSILNVVEDSRIERKIKSKYPGLKNSFVKAYNELVEKDFFGTQDKNINALNFIDRVNLHCKGGATLAIKFDDDESALLQDVESTETWDEVVDVTKRIIEFMKEQQDEKSQGQGQTDTDGEFSIDNLEFDEFSGEEMSDETGESDETKEDANLLSEESGDISKPENGSGSNYDDIRSFTDEAFRENESKIFSKENLHYTYGNIPKYDIEKTIWDYKNIYAKYVEENYNVARDEFTKFRRESSKVVSYLVKEFELRKNADQLKRATIAKTGELNMSKIFSYQFSEDIFKKISVVPGGKSHGLVMYLDWSGSMAVHLGNTMKQLFNLVMFCKKVNIPFEVYAFIQDTDEDRMYNPTPKEGDVIMDKFCLMNILSSRMSASDFMTAGGALFEMSGLGSYKWAGRGPEWFRMGGTPLNEAVISAMEIVPHFQKKNKLQIVNTVFLTDGDGSYVRDIYNTNGLRDDYSSYRNVPRGASKRFVFRDPVTKHEESYSELNSGSVRMKQTNALIRLLKRRTNSHVIGFYIGHTREIRNRVRDFYPDLEWYQADKKMEEFRKSKFMVANQTGFDDYYILKSTAMDIDEDTEFEVAENATTRGLVSAFNKYAGNRINNRVILNRFIGLIS